LAGVSDAVFNNLRGDRVSDIGLNYAALEKTNPRIVCCSLSAFGTTGDRADEPGYDYLMQAMAGYMSFTGDPESPPTKCGVSVVDHAAGIAAALGLVAALFNAKRTGKGCDVEVSLLDTALSMLTYLAAWNLNKGYEPEKIEDSSHQTIVPAQNFKTKDGYIVIFCAKEKFWQNLCQVLEVPNLAQDPRCNSFDVRLKNRKFLLSTVKPIFLSKTTGEWLELLRGKVPCASVNSLGAALSDAQVVRDMIVEVDHPVFGRVKQVDSPIRMGRRRKPDAAPALGEHTEDILTRLLGYSKDQLRTLREQRTI
jgi:crotonobetainyl-CoA:carnitine CoA-transferase CaiB-like acyl-CoA transferase